MTLAEQGGVGLGEGDVVGPALGGQAAGLVEQLAREIEGGQAAVTEGPKAERHPAGAATGFEQVRGAIGKKTLDQHALRLP